MRSRYKMQEHKVCTYAWQCVSVRVLQVVNSRAHSVDIFYAFSSLKETGNPRFFIS